MTTEKTMSEREVIIVRMYDAPREQVFSAWTDTEQLRRWFGPKMFTNPVCEADARVGGKWHIVMRGPDGAEYPCGGIYREIVKPSKLVFTNNATDKDGKIILEGMTTVLFEDEDGKTKLTLKTRGVAKVDYAAAYLTGMEEGWSQSLEKLVELFSCDREIVISRVFDAPREMVFEAMTDPKQVVKWWGPRGFSTTIEVMDVRPGGQWKHVMHGPDGANYPNYSVFKEVVKPQRIVYSLGGHREGGGSEVRSEATWTFEELDKGKTRVTIRMVFPTADDCRRVDKEYGAIEGGKQTLQRLGEYLAK